MRSTFATFCSVSSIVALLYLVALRMHAQVMSYPNRTNSDASQSDKPYSQRTWAIDEADSRAEEEAERIVSLPAEKIILLLQQEPGLFLQVKKMLVRKAYQQGRVLEPQELTDEALFRLIRQDENVRVVITNEIVDRNYIRAKPTREELERNWRRQAALNGGTGQAQQSRGGTSSNQEDLY